MMSREQNPVWNPGWLDSAEPALPDAKIFAGTWSERNWRNIPGPFYGAATDTCGTGPIVAPKNVLLDSNGQEYIVIQPRNTDELTSVVEAADHDPFAGYGADGNSHWNSDLVRRWWSQRNHLQDELVESLRKHAERGGDESYRSTVESLLHFLEVEAEQYTRQYLYWIDNGRRAGKGDILPTLG